MPRGPQRLHASVALPVGATLAVLALAEAMKAGNLMPVFVPAPSQIASEIVRSPAPVLDSIGSTALTAVLGYAAAATAAVSAAALSVLVRALSGPIYTVGVMLHSIPIIATAPLLALWLGTGPSLRIVIAALASQFPMLVGTMQGLRAADARQLELMRVLSASRLQSLSYLLVPSALPYLFAGFKVAAPSAVLGAVTAEWAGADRGVGAMMLYALFSYDTVKVWLAVILTCALAAAAYGVGALIERRVVFWDRSVELSP